LLASSRRRPPRPPPFPYTTLFRSRGVDDDRARAAPAARLLRVVAPDGVVRGVGARHHTAVRPVPCTRRAGVPVLGLARTVPGVRSEEHTSELQSRENLVCRLLREK